jgi:hypothetical protein
LPRSMPILRQIKSKGRLNCYVLKEFAKMR